MLITDLIKSYLIFVLVCSNLKLMYRFTKLSYSEFFFQKNSSKNSKVYNQLSNIYFKAAVLDQRHQS